MSIPPPRPVGPVHTMSITGYLLPWDDDRPACIMVDGANEVFIAIFSTIEKLRAAMVNIPYKTVKEIDDGADFITSIFEAPQNFRIMADPYMNDAGRLRFTEIFRDGKTSVH